VAGGYFVCALWQYDIKPLCASPRESLFRLVILRVVIHLCADEFTPGVVVNVMVVDRQHHPGSGYLSTTWMFFCALFNNPGYQRVDSSQNGPMFEVV
jgi:hypothetical protein